MERLHERKVTRHEGRKHHSADPPPSDIDGDAVSEALCRLWFVKTALSISNPMGNDSASNGICLVMGDALDVLEVELAGIIR